MSNAETAANDEISPWTLTSWVLSFILNAAGQPSGRLMGLQPHEHIDLRRCFPVKYALDALLALLSWAELVVSRSRTPREAAAIVLRGRLADGTTQSHDDVESRLRAVKSGAAMRAIGFVTGVLPVFIKLCACEGVSALQVLGCLWVAPWVVFETLILASTPALHPSDDLPLYDSRPQRLQRPFSFAADIINIILCSTPPFMFALDAWRNVAAVGLAGSSPLDVLVLLAASCIVFLCISWGSIVVVMMKVERDGVLRKRLKQVFTFGAAVMLGGIWLPLAIWFSRAAESFEVAFTIFLGAILVGFLVISFIRQTFWKTDIYHLVNIFGAMASILLHIFVNYNEKSSYQPQ